MKYKFLSWDQFRESCREDAFLWYTNGYTADELTAADILNEYPEEYWEDVEYAPDALSRSFTAEEIAEQTLDYIAKFEEVEI